MIFRSVKTYLESVGCSGPKISEREEKQEILNHRFQQSSFYGYFPRTRAWPLITSLPGSSREYTPTDANIYHKCLLFLRINCFINFTLKHKGPNNI